MVVQFHQLLMCSFFKALQKIEISEFFIFCEFWNCSVTKVWKFFGRTWFFRIHKNLRKKFGNKSGSKNPVFGLKNPVLGSKKPCFRGKNRDIQTFQIYRIFRICSIPNFPKIKKKWRQNQILKIAKNSFQLEFRLEHSSSSLECRALAFLTISFNHKVKHNKLKVQKSCG